MKNKRLALLLPSLLLGMSLQAVDIAWVSFHPADNEPSGAAATAGFTQAPDVGYTALLEASGHNVTRFVTVDNLDANPDLIASLETNDLVIISRSVPSGHYQDANETAAWSSFITKPVIILGGYITRNNRLGLTTGDTMVDVDVQQVRLRANAPLHPIFDGVPLDADNLMVNPYAQRVTFTNTASEEVLQFGISINNNTIRAGGTVLGTVGTAGAAGVNGLVIGEYPSGITTHRDVLAGNRLVLLTGSRESGVTSEAAGIFDLLPDGEKIFLNAVDYMTVPTAPIITRELASGVNLLAGDAWTFDAGVIGSAPLTFQWYKDGQALPSGTEALLSFTSLVAADAGEYYVIAANEVGRATSSVASLQFATFSTPSITNGLVSYWPLNAAVGGKTPDVVSGYDMNMVNMGETNVVPGKFGNAFFFTNENRTMLQRINSPGEDLPIYSKSNFSVSMWVNGPIQPDRRLYSEGSTLQNNTLFNIGTHNGGLDGTVDIYIRSDTGALNLDHVHSVAPAFDYVTWNHIAYVQRDVGGGQMRANLYVNGVLDPVVIAPIRPLNPNTTSIGGILRAAPSAWYTGLIDEVAVWERALSPEEIEILQVTAITNAPSRLQPLAINKFRTDLPTVATGGSATLRWDTSINVDQVTIDQGIGDVTSATVGGVGSRSITVNETTTYTLTATRGDETVTAITTVTALDGIEPGWNLLDNFDRYAPGPLADVEYWVDAGGDSVQVTNYQGNTVLRNTAGSSLAVLPLGDLTIRDGEAGTLFFRMITGTDTASGITNIVGLTDKTQRGYGDAFLNIGPVLYAAALTNEVFAIDTNAWYLGARNGYYGNNSSPPVDYPAQPLQPETIYNVWIDITNAPMDLYISDTFSAYVQKEGETQRTLLFQDFQSDRDFFYVEAVLGGMTEDLDKLVVLGNNATQSAMFDDFYISKGAFNTTVPRPYGFTGAVGPLPALQIGRSGEQLQIQWTTGTLQESSSLTGEWNDVPGANPPSYTVTPGAGAKFYRARQ